jgi:predicted dehydrogenase
MSTLSFAVSEPPIRAAADRETKPLKIVFWGLGSIGTRLARILQENFPHELYVYREIGRNPNPLELPEIGTVEELMQVAPDVAFITNPTACHLSTAIQAARLGLDLFIEKPLSDSLEEVAVLLDLVRNKELVTHVGCQLRFDPLIKKLKDLVKTEEVFYARICCSSYLPDWRPGRDYTEIYSSKKALGGGVLLDLIHELDYASWLLGDIVGLEGEAGRISPLLIETEDYADLLIHHADGIRSQIHLDYFGRIPQRKIEIFGRDLTVQADLIERTLIRSVKGSKTAAMVPCDSRDFPFREQLGYFFDCLRNRIISMNNVEEHLKVLGPVLSFKNRGNGSWEKIG